MLRFLTLLLAYQLIGEVLSVGFHLPLPGPVVGMALLFGTLVVRGTVVPTDLSLTAHGLLKHLSLLFVPAGVGVVLHLGLLQSEWQAITVSLLVSTLATIAVTAVVMVWLSKYMGDQTVGKPGGQTIGNQNEMPDD